MAALAVIGLIAATIGLAVRPSSNVNGLLTLIGVVAVAAALALWLIGGGKVSFTWGMPKSRPPYL